MKQLRPLKSLYTFLLLSLLTLPALAQQSFPPQNPDTNLTPGAVLPVTARDICVVGYTKKVRNVPESVKRQVYAEYGITSRQPGEYEVDHLISLELGGSNAIGNLWPQSYVTTPYNAHIKDTLENKLHRMVCSGQMELRAAQQEIATDWVSAYQRYVLKQNPGPLANARRPTQPIVASNSSNQGARKPTYPTSNNVRTNTPSLRRPSPENIPPVVAHTRPRRVPMPQEQPSPDNSQETGQGRASDQNEPQSQTTVSSGSYKPRSHYRIVYSHQRKASKRCKLGNLWCGFGLLK